MFQIARRTETVSVCKVLSVSVRYSWGHYIFFFCEHVYRALMRVRVRDRGREREREREGGREECKCVCVCV